jgi:lysophospholipase L1-like esterase
MAWICLIALTPVSLLAPLFAQSQGNDMLSAKEAAQLTARIADLLEATRIVMPELSRAGAPLQENFRQGVKTLETTATHNHTGILYRMLANAKAYLQLSDTLTKPADFSEDIRKQLAELRARIQRLDAHFLATLDQRELQVLGSDRDNLRRYADENGTVGPVDPKQPRVVFLGDSITDGWRLDQYFTRKTYLNRGISGQITGQMLGRTKPDVIDLRAKAAVVLGGTNDLARGVPDATIRHNLEALGTLAQAAGIVPIMASILPVNDYHQDANPRFRRTVLRSPARIAELNRWLASLCRSNNWVYLDYHTSMVDTDGRLQKDLSDDGLHPNSEGYKVMVPLAQQAIDSALRTTVRRPRRRAR